MDDFDAGLARRALADYQAALARADIVVTVAGGLVTGVRTRDGKGSHVVVDYDDLESEFPAIVAAVEERVATAFAGTDTAW